MKRLIKRYDIDLMKGLLVAYLVTFVVSLLVGFGIVSVSNKRFEKNAYEYNKVLVNKAKEFVDSMTTDVELYAKSVQNNSQIINIMQQEKLTVHDYDKLFPLIEDINTFKNSHEYIDDVYIWCGNSDVMVGDNIYTPLQIYTDKSFGDINMFDEWKNEYLQANRYMEYLPDTYIEGKKGLNFVNTIYKNKQSTERVGAVVIRVNVDMLVNDVFMNGFSSNSSFYVLNNLKKPLISYNLNESDIEQIPYIDLEGNGQLETKERRLIVFDNLSKNHWIYAVGDTKVNVLKNVYSIQMYFSAILILYALIGLFFAYFGLKKSTKKVDDLTTQIGVKRKNIPASIDDIRKRVGEIQEEKREYETIVKTYENDRFLKFISGEGGVENREIPNGISLTQDNIRVMVAKIIDKGIFDTDDKEDEGVPAYCLINMLDELLDNVCTYYVANKSNNYVIYLLNYSMAEDELKQRLSVDVCEKVQKMLLNELCVNIEFAVSRTTQNHSDIPYLYSEALMLFDYQYMKTNAVLHYFDDFEGQNQSELYYYPSGYEESIMACIEAGNKKGASGILDELLQKNLRSTNCDLKYFLFYSLLGIYVKAIEKVRYTNSKTNYFLDKANKASPAFLDEYVRELCQEMLAICDFVENLKQNDVDRIATDVERYILDNFADVNLNLNTIADRFNVSRQTLSKKFNAAYGKKVGDYILEVRVNESKKIMQRMNMNISDVASLVGYVDSNSFIRAFKKQCGITPGQYKNNLVDSNTD